ncbi:MAG: hypothetical protein WCD36_00710 [Rhodanobacteraceae bacterium]
MRWITVVFTASLAAIACICETACADSWLLPGVSTYQSPNKHWRLTVTPRTIASPLAYFEDKLDKKPQAGGSPGDRQKHARGRMEHFEHGQWKLVWLEPLVNDVAPVEAIVSNSGWSATFDNWHSAGYGSDAVVIYDNHGKKIRNLSLGDFLPERYIRGLPHSVSSIWWGKGHHFSSDGKRLILRVVVPPDPDAETGSPADEPDYVERAVTLATGEVLPAHGPAWERAVRAASLAADKLDAEQARRVAAFKAPLSPPTTNDLPSWYDYITEAFFRLDREWKDQFPAREVLPSPSSSDYARLREYLRDALSDPTDSSGPIVLASPDPDNLIRTVSSITATLPANSLSKARIYIAAPASMRQAAAESVKRTGAKFILVDMQKPIPQRPERLRHTLRP